jgi:hypothetical protein
VAAAPDEDAPEDDAPEDDELPLELPPSLEDLLPSDEAVFALEPGIEDEERESVR